MHFSCLIVGPDFEAQIAPFDENLEVDPYIDECGWCGYNNEPPDATCENCKGSGKETTTRNPRGKWDYWRLGGRWRGFLVLKEGATSGVFGEEGYEWDHERKSGREIPDWSGTADQALAGDVDWLATIAATHPGEGGEYRTYTLVCEGVWRESDIRVDSAPIGERLVDDPNYIPLWDRLVTNLDPNTLVTVVDYHS